MKPKLLYWICRAVKKINSDIKDMAKIAFGLSAYLVVVIASIEIKMFLDGW